jgi:1-acyl-sn-glycerol-3-phosphate acyltransferase
MIYTMAGYTRTDTTYADIDYSEYLGPDWKKEYKGASTLISNHISWFDSCFAIVYYFPTIVARDSLQKTPFIGSVLRAMSTIFLARVGNDAKESKRLAAQ